MSLRGLELSPKQKAAMVIVSLGAEKASKIYKYLIEGSFGIIGLDILKLGDLVGELLQFVFVEILIYL